MIFLASKYILGKSIITTIIISGGSVIPLGMIINIIILLVRGCQQSHWVGAKINFGQSCLLCMHNVEIEQLYEKSYLVDETDFKGVMKIINHKRNCRPCLHIFCVLSYVFFSCIHRVSGPAICHLP